jgi:hypothetical protein
MVLLGIIISIINYPCPRLAPLGGRFELSNSIADNGIAISSNQIVQLINRLAAKSPPRHTNDYWPERFEDVAGQMEPEVKMAYVRLKQVGPRAFPFLAKAKDDSRYSYSQVDSVWCNYTVGYAARQIVVECVDIVSQFYLVRDNPNGKNGCPSFDLMITRIGFDVYADRAAKQSLRRLQAEYIKWRIAEEKEFGFIDDFQMQFYLDQSLDALSSLAR